MQYRKARVNPSQRSAEKPHDAWVIYGEKRKRFCKEWTLYMYIWLGKFGEYIIHHSMTCMQSSYMLKCSSELC